MKKQDAFTLLEVLVSTVILAVVISGIANIFLSGKRYILHSNARMTGGELGRFFLDPLQMDVRQDQWGVSGSNCLNGGSCSGFEIINSIKYTPAYTITKDSPIANLNKVKVNITWDEISP